MKLRPIHFGEDNQIPDGVYLDLPEKIYFAQKSATRAGERALGSTDNSHLWKNGEGWWWSSPYNPFYKESTSESQNMGSATHTLLLEGREAFEARYAVEPNPNDYVDLVKSLDDIKSAMRERGCPMPKANSPKSDWIEAAKVYLSDRPIWDDILHKHARKNIGKLSVSAQEMFHLDVMHESALQDPDMAVACKAGGGEPITELSVFYTLGDGTRCRFRFDSFLPSCNVELKTLDNFRNKDPLEAIGANIGENNYDIQAALGFEARRWAYYFIETGQIYGGTEDKQAWLKLYPKMAPLDKGSEAGWFHLWIFIQKPDDKGRAPVLAPVKMNFGSMAHRDGFRKAMHGLNTYMAARETFGLRTPWRKILPVQTLQADGPNSVSIPFWSRQPTPVADEEAALNWRN